MSTGTPRSIHEITEMCRQVLGKRYDYESVAAAIWFEAWTNLGSPQNVTKVPASWSFVHNRCKDHLRRRNTELRVNETRVNSQELTVLETVVVDPDLFTRLMANAILDALEREFVYRFFMLDQRLQPIALAMGLSLKRLLEIKTRAIEELKRVSRSLDT